MSPAPRVSASRRSPSAIAPRLFAAALLLLCIGQPGWGQDKKSDAGEIDYSGPAPKGYEFGGGKVFLSRPQGQNIIRRSVDVGPHFWAWVEEHPKETWSKSEYNKTYWMYVGEELHGAIVRKSDAAKARYERIMGGMIQAMKQISAEDKRAQPWLYDKAYVEYSTQIKEVEKDLGKDFCSPLREQKERLRQARNKSMVDLNEEDMKKGKELAAKVAAKTKQADIEKYTDKMGGKSLEGGYEAGLEMFHKGGPSDKMSTSDSSPGKQSKGMPMVGRDLPAGKIGEAKSKYDDGPKEKDVPPVKKKDEPGFFSKAGDFLSENQVPLSMSVVGMAVGIATGGGPTGAVAGAGVGLGAGILAKNIFLNKDKSSAEEKKKKEKGKEGEKRSEKQKETKAEKEEEKPSETEEE